jgi:5-methylcytosine-specific restriction endonuclease McrA
MKHSVLMLDSAGFPHEWVSWETAVTAFCKGNIAWSLGEETIYRGGVSRLTGSTSTVAVPSIIAFKGHATQSRRTAPLTNKNLFGRDRNMCAYCGKVYTQKDLTRDHIIPVSRGGKNTYKNCVTACKGCNCRKDNKLLSECGMTLLYLPYVPSRVEHLILANRNVLADQMSFLMKCLPEHSRLHNLG